MYTLKVSYGDYDDVDGRDTETETVNILGTYESLGEACEAARRKFKAIMERLSDDLDIRCDVIEAYSDEYYVTYGYFDRADNKHYYMVCVIYD